MMGLDKQIVAFKLRCRISRRFQKRYVWWTNEDVYARALRLNLFLVTWVAQQQAFPSVQQQVRTITSETSKIRHVRGVRNEKGLNLVLFQ
jgi:hypothetical protein